MKILVIRGGGLGDFVVTLPALKLVREKWPVAQLEILGHPKIAEIALDRFYLQGVRSVNHGPLAAFFTPRAVLDPAWMDYFGSFDLVASYFYDPDGLFLTNLQRCHPGRILTHSPRVPDNFRWPAARYFAEMLGPLNLSLGDDASSRLFLTAGDSDGASAFLSGLQPGRILIAVHPGSGSETKNWPAQKWAEWGLRLAETHPHLTFLLVEGEADDAPTRALVEAWKEIPLLRARWLPLPILGALFRRCALFVGHDSGVTHLAAAADGELPIISLFGPTEPEVWAPPRAGVKVLRAASAMSSLEVANVLAATQEALKAREQ